MIDNKLLYPAVAGAAGYYAGKKNVKWAAAGAALGYWLAMKLEPPMTAGEQLEAVTSGGGGGGGGSTPYVAPHVPVTAAVEATTEKTGLLPARDFSVRSPIVAEAIKKTRMEMVAPTKAQLTQQLISQGVRTGSGAGYALAKLFGYIDETSVPAGKEGINIIEQRAVDAFERQRQTLFSPQRWDITGSGVGAGGSATELQEAITARAGVGAASPLDRSPSASTPTPAPVPVPVSSERSDAGGGLTLMSPDRAADVLSRVAATADDPNRGGKWVRAMVQSLTANIDSPSPAPSRRSAASRQRIAAAARSKKSTTSQRLSGSTTTALAAKPTMVAMPVMTPKLTALEVKPQAKVVSSTLTAINRLRK